MNPSPPLVPTCKEGRKERARTFRIVCTFRGSRLEVLHKNYLFWTCWKVFTKTLVRSYFNKIVRHVTVLEQDSTTVAFLGIFPKSVEQLFCYLWTASVISLYLHKYLHIFPIHFHLNHSISYGCFQVYIIIGIYHITLLILLYFTCRLETM